MQIILLLLFLTLSGCMSSGNPAVRDEAAVEKIKIGVTTKDEVRSLLGKPTTVTRSAGQVPIGAGLPMTSNMNLEIWGYSHISVETDAATFIPVVGLFAGGATSTVSSLTLTFDEQGIVRSVQTSQSEGRSGMGSGSGNKKTYDPKESY